MKIQTNKGIIEVKTEEKNDYIAINAIENNKIIGYLNFKVENRDKIWIYKIETKKKHQNKGVGSALLMALDAYALENNIFWTESKYYPDNEYAKPLYEKFGYEIYKDGYETYVGKNFNFKKIKKEIMPKIIKEEVELEK